MGRPRPRKARRDTAILKGLFLEAEVRTWGREKGSGAATGTDSARLDWPTGWGQGEKRERGSRHLLGASVGAAPSQVEDLRPHLPLWPELCLCKTDALSPTVHRRCCGQGREDRQKRLPGEPQPEQEADDKIQTTWRW